MLVSAREISTNVGVNINIQHKPMKFQGTVSSPLSQAQTSQRETEAVKKTVHTTSVTEPATGNQGYLLVLHYSDQ